MWASEIRAMSFTFLAEESAPRPTGGLAHVVGLERPMMVSASAYRGRRFLGQHVRREEARGRID